MLDLVLCAGTPRYNAQLIRSQMFFRLYFRPRSWASSDEHTCDEMTAKILYNLVRKYFFQLKVGEADLSEVKKNAE